MREIVTYLISGGKVGDILRAVRPSVLSIIFKKYEKGIRNDTYLLSRHLRNSENTIVTNAPYSTLASHLR